MVGVALRGPPHRPSRLPPRSHVSRHLCPLQHPALLAAASPLRAPAAASPLRPVRAHGPVQPLRGQARFPLSVTPSLVASLSVPPHAVDGRLVPTVSGGASQQTVDAHSSPGDSAPWAGCVGESCPGGVRTGLRRRSRHRVPGRALPSTRASAHGALHHDRGSFQSRSETSAQTYELPRRMCAALHEHTPRTGLRADGGRVCARAQTVPYSRSSHVRNSVSMGRQLR